MSERYSIIKGYVDDDDVIIPLWDPSITYSKGEYYHDEERIKVKDVVFDVKTKQLSKGIELDLYSININFTIGEEVYVETSLRGDGYFSQKAAYKSKIVDIVYKEFESESIKGSKLEKYRIEQISKQYKDFELDTEALYWLKHWQPQFLLSNGKPVRSHYDLFKILDNESVN